MDCRERRKRAYRKSGTSVLLADVINFINSADYSPQNGDTWGNWHLHAEGLSLVYIEADGREMYEIYLDEICTCAAMLDWIFQIANKSWASAEDVGNLVQALEDLFLPQANFCSFRTPKDHTISEVSKYLRSRIAS